MSSRNLNPVVVLGSVHVCLRQSHHVGQASLKLKIPQPLPQVLRLKACDTTLYFRSLNSERAFPNPKSQGAGGLGITLRMHFNSLFTILKEVLQILTLK